MTSYWSFSLTTTSLVIAAMVLAITAWFGIQNWSRNSHSPRILWLETLRFTIVALLLFTVL